MTSKHLSLRSCRMGYGKRIEVVIALLQQLELCLSPLPWLLRLEIGI